MCDCRTLQDPHQHAADRIEASSERQQPCFHLETPSHGVYVSSRRRCHLVTGQLKETLIRADATIDGPLRGGGPVSRSRGVHPQGSRPTSAASRS